MLDTTRAKLLSAYADSVGYIASLNEERVRLLQLTSDEAEMNKVEHKNDAFQRLNYLNSVWTLQSRVSAVESDLRELADTLSSGGGNGEDFRTSGEGEQFKRMLADEVERLGESLVKLKLELVELLIPEEPEDKENAVLELSAGVGGLESRIFCSEMFDMYRLYAAANEWSFTPVKVFTEQTELGEMMRQAVVEIDGAAVFRQLKFESGVHRVQRVPRTEAKGRIHTSTVGVVVSPKPTEINVKINPKDIKIETKTSGGPGGQHANKTESAVRITHLPTGILVYCDEERHQLQNRHRAMRNLEQKLYERAYEAQLSKRQANRKMQIGSSARSERIRTYNFIQDRITDHRLDENFHGIDRFLAGNLHKTIENLRYEQQFEVLQEILESFKRENKQTN